MSYEGPGIYRHYKGGIYTALGVAEHETTGARLVIYISHSEEHTLDRGERGAYFVARPLTSDDGPDAWNEQATLNGRVVERFQAWR